MTTRPDIITKNRKAEKAENVHTDRRGNTSKQKCHTK